MSFRFAGRDADLIGLRGANLADPDDAEAGFRQRRRTSMVWPGKLKKPTPIETRAILAQIDGDTGLLLDERMALGRYP